MDTRVVFKSSAFPKYENEDAETVNPNRWGKRLAEYIRDNLPRHGVATGEILCEDWGWLVFVKNDDFSLWVGCGPLDDPFGEGEEVSLSGEEPSITEFCVFVTAEPGLFQRLFRKVDTKPAVEKVVAGLKSMMADSDSFQDVEWEE